MPWIRGQTKQPAGKGTREKERQGFRKIQSDVRASRRKACMRQISSSKSKSNTTHSLSHAKHESYRLHLFKQHCKTHANEATNIKLHRSCVCKRRKCLYMLQHYIVVFYTHSFIFFHVSVCYGMCISQSVCICLYSLQHLCMRHACMQLSTGLVMHLDFQHSLCLHVWRANICL